MAEVKVNSNRIGLMTILFVVFLVLKLCDVIGHGGGLQHRFGVRLP
jgi:hypothetical protein